LGIFTRKPKTPLEKRIGYKFKDRELLQQALNHRSWIHENGEGDVLNSNERMEFLGDAVLELIVAEHLFREFPDSNEGDLTEFRRILVNGKLLAQKAAQLGLDREINLSSAEDGMGGRAKESILSDSYEALLGAIFLDGGIKAAKNFIEKFHLADRDTQFESDKHINFKGRLLEYTQARGETAEYQVISERGPDHRKTFEIAVLISGTEVGRGKGPSKKTAEQAAAKNAMENI